MTINISMPRTESELRPSILVIGVGGAGGNAVNNMIRSNLEGVEFLVCNTDSQSLNQSIAERKIQMGVTITQGLGAGSRPDIGSAAAEEAMEEIQHHLNGVHMVFIAAGMGGGTGTGAAPVIARTARDQGILTVGVVTKPFHFEGTHRMRIAEAGIEELQQYVDTLIIIPNQNLFRIANEKTTFADAFKMADDVLHCGVRGVTDLMVMPGLINLDFADIRTVMSEMGKAMMGTGEAEGDKRAIEAAERAISNPLLDDVTMQGAKGVLINITGGMDMTLFEVDEAANRIREEVDSEANIIFGSTFDEVLEGKMRVSVVATGIEAVAVTNPRTMPTGLVRVAGRAPAEATAVPADASETPEPETSDETPTEAADETSAQIGRDSLHDETITANQPSTHVVETAAAQPQTRPAPRPVAMPQPSRAAFIPPRPVRPSESATARRTAEPFAAAAMENGHKGEPEPRRRAPTLFERMTGTGRARQTKQERPSVDGESELFPRPAAVRGDASAGIASQPRLGGLDPADRVAPSAAEEEMLEIPAFLRRQAN